MDWKRAARIVLLGLATLCVAILVGLASFCVVWRTDRSSSLIELPDWTGFATDEAASRARALGVALEVAERRHDPGVATDRIVQQDPAPGTRVRRGRTVRVVISLGGETHAVPELRGQPARQAELELRRQGLAAGFEARVHDADAPAGQVIEQTPSGGALSVSGELVHRLVSEGPRPPRWVMPDLTGRPLRDVQEWITLCGFRSGAVRKVPADGGRSGTIVGQSPPSGYPIARRDPVELTVAE
ncbi:MAG TPA: PASTA domain-containing protein [Candidatus Polarisedimenticolaceae bacterium]|nr:PASTA domain-containing protein [Candidatus Polarisedimenticolaceae bacterium]